MKKVIKTTILLILLIFVLTNLSFSALTPNDFSSPDYRNVEDIRKVGGSILEILAIIASAISIIAIIALGIKYMLGSVEERASYKKTLLPYFIGAIFVFGATAIPEVIYKMITK